jgi:hypothetical protein
VGAKTQQALDCEHDYIELTTAAIAVVELRELSLRIPTVLLSPAMPLTSSIFKTDEDAKAIQIDARNPAKTMQNRASLDPK